MTKAEIFVRLQEASSLWVEGLPPTADELKQQLTTSGFDVGTIEEEDGEYKAELLAEDENVNLTLARTQVL